MLLLIVQIDNVVVGVDLYEIGAIAVVACFGFGGHCCCSYRTLLLFGIVNSEAVVVARIVRCYCLLLSIRTPTLLLRTFLEVDWTLLEDDSDRILLEDDSDQTLLEVDQTLLLDDSDDDVVVDRFVRQRCCCCCCCCCIGD